MMKTTRLCALLALALPLLGAASPSPAPEAAVDVSSEQGTVLVDDQGLEPVPCRCGPSLLLFGPFGCKCPFDLLVSALKPGTCTDAKGEPPCSPVTRCSVSLRLWWVGEDEGCETPLKPLFAPMKASCGSFGTQVFFCPAGPGLVTAFLLCKPCKP